MIGFAICAVTIHFKSQRIVEVVRSKCDCMVTISSHYHHCGWVGHCEADYEFKRMKPCKNESCLIFYVSIMQISICLISQVLLKEGYDM